MAHLLVSLSLPQADAVSTTDLQRCMLFLKYRLYIAVLMGSFCQESRGSLQLLPA